jgi:hypothetical protein
VLSVVLWAWAPNVRVSLGLVIPVGIAILVVLLTSVLTLIEATLKARAKVEEIEGDRDRIQAEYAGYKAKSSLPEVVEGREPFVGIKGESLCFLRSSDLFSIDSLTREVAVAEVDDPITVWRKAGGESVNSPSPFILYTLRNLEPARPVGVDRVDFLAT